VRLEWESERREKTSAEWRWTAGNGRSWTLERRDMGGKSDGFDDTPKPP
jgi:hypothetical protein